MILNYYLFNASLTLSATMVSFIASTSTKHNHHKAALSARLAHIAAVTLRGCLALALLHKQVDTLLCLGFVGVGFSLRSPHKLNVNAHNILRQLLIIEVPLLDTVKCVKRLPLSALIPPSLVAMIIWYKFNSLTPATAALATLIIF